MSIRLEHVTYLYSPGTVFEYRALDDVSLEIGPGEFVGLIGRTGSGKSTLIQHLNGLIQPTSGHVFFQDEDIWAEGYDRRRLRFHVGLVFQYPEHQLFDSDILSDVCFGPKNQGLSADEARGRAVRALEQVGIEEPLFDKSPFEISGGQKRRVAIAGVLAMNPDVLVLDEPTAGLDPGGRREILSLIDTLHRDRGITIVLVSHSMEDIADHAGRIIVMNDGRKRFDAAPKEVFSHFRELENMGLSVPQVTALMNRLAERGLNVETGVTTVEEARESILKALGGSRRQRM